MDIICEHDFRCDYTPAVTDGNILKIKSCIKCGAEETFEETTEAIFPDIIYACPYYDNRYYWINESDAEGWNVAQYYHDYLVKIKDARIAELETFIEAIGYDLP